MNNLLGRIFSGILCTFILSVLALAPFSPTFQNNTVYLHEQTVEAGSIFLCPEGGCASRGGQLVNDALVGIGNAIDSITAWASNLMVVKEFSLDGIAWMFINAILETMLRDIINWVNSGFKGSPMFVQDIGGFILDVADGVAGDFILNNTNLGFFCSPFSLDIRLSLASQYVSGRNWRPQCSISGILENIENFTITIDGQVNLGAAYNSRSFAAGGWAWWLGTTQDQENNIYGAQAMAQAQFMARLANARGQELFKLDTGRLFRGLEICDVVANETVVESPAGGAPAANSGAPIPVPRPTPTASAGSAVPTVAGASVDMTPTSLAPTEAPAPVARGQCKTATPGVVVEKLLNKHLGVPLDRLTIADEINELIAALLAQMARFVLNGLGLTGFSAQPFKAKNGQVYANLLAAIEDGADGDLGYSADSSIGGAPGTLGSNNNGEVEDYLDLLNHIIGTVDTEEEFLENARFVFPGSISTNSLPEALLDARADAIAERAEATTKLAQFEALVAEQETASDLRANEIEVELIELRSTMPGATNKAQLELDILESFTPAIKTFRAKLQSEILSAGGTVPDIGTEEIPDLSAVPPMILFHADRLTFPEDSFIDTTTLRWASTDQENTTCEADNAWFGSRPPQGTESVTFTGFDVFTLTCTNEAGSATESVTLRSETNQTGE